MQKFEFLNYDVVKNVSSCGSHLQYLFPDCNRTVVDQTAGQSGSCVVDYRNGIYTFSNHEHACKYLAPYSSHF